MNREAYLHILRTYGRNPRQWLGYTLVLASSVINRVVIVTIMATVVSEVAGHNIPGAKHHILYFMGAYLAGTLAWTLGEWISMRTENDEYEKLMLEYHDKLVTKDMAFYRDNQTGYLATAFRQYLDGAMQLVRFLRGEALGTTVSLVTPVVVLLFANVQVGMVVLVVVAIQIVYVIWSSAKAHKYRHMTHEIYRKITGEVSDEITNIVAFKAGGIESTSRSKLDNLAKQETKAFTLRHRTSLLLDLPRGLVTVIGMAIAVYLIITTTTNDARTLGLVVLTLTYMFQILRSVSTLPELMHTHDDLVTKLAPPLAYLSTEHETIRDPAEPLPFRVSEGEISIADVGFSYDAHSAEHTRIAVFKHLTITIQGGEQVGIVGLSGAGKSTLANLLMRFDDVESGVIAIDGIDIRAVRQSDLRQHIAYVPQEPILFHRTVRENIAYYRPDVSDAEVTRAAKAAHAHDFIQQLPDGYDTVVGERGVKLSGGQKQRIAIARAVLKKAPIMIFDEATSALDSESEQIIQRALPEILGKQTAIIIAHRLSTIANLDRIIVMHGGKVIEEGTHAGLLKKRGRYYDLWQRQIAGSME